jgi:GNAT superfamily N-acetyltransferase
MTNEAEGTQRRVVGISRPQPAEFEAWSRLWESYLEFYGAVRPAELYRHNWRRIQDPRRELDCLFARREDGTPTGLAHFLFHSTAWSAASVCYLQDLFVSPPHRGAGVGAALIQAVAEAAAAAGAEKLYWLTRADNLDARVLYDRVGRDTGFVKYELVSVSAPRGNAASRQPARRSPPC